MSNARGKEITEIADRLEELGDDIDSMKYELEELREEIMNNDKGKEAEKNLRTIETVLIKLNYIDMLGAADSLRELL